MLGLQMWATVSGLLMSLGTELRLVGLHDMYFYPLSHLIGPQ